MSRRQDIGAVLRGARTRRGIDLEQAARETCIHLRYLEALERTAPLREFPAPVYARMFLREYARYLGLDPQPLVEVFRAGERPAQPSLRLLPGPAATRRRPARRVWTLLLAIAVVGAAAAAVVVARTRGAPETRPAAPSLDAGSGGGAVGLGLALDLRVRGERCWVRLVSDGDELVRRTVRPGYHRAFRADRRLVVVLGNPDATVVTLNGERLRTPGDRRGVYAVRITERLGEVRVVTLPWRR